MQAAVFHGREDVRIEDVPRPDPGPGEVLLRIDAVGICGTDAHEFDSGPHMFPLRDPHPRSGHGGPMILGHEFTGRVVAVGSSVDAFVEGDRVVSGAGISCGECHWCERGRTNLCARYYTAGLERHGGAAQFCSVPASTCVPVDDGLSPDAAALGQPMSIAVHAMRRGRLQAGEVAVIIGAGGIGAFLIYAAVERGATVVVSDFDEDRLAIASALGAHHTVDPSAGDLGELLEDEGLIPSAVYEVSGTRGGLTEALAVAPRGCRLVMVGIQSGAREMDLRTLTLREVELIGTNAHIVGSDLPEAMRLLASRTDGWSDVAPVALSLQDLVSDGLAPLAAGRSSRIKTLIDPWADETRPTRM